MNLMRMSVCVCVCVRLVKEYREGESPRQRQYKKRSKGHSKNFSFLVAFQREKNEFGLALLLLVLHLFYFFSMDKSVLPWCELRAELKCRFVLRLRRRVFFGETGACLSRVRRQRHYKLIVNKRKRKKKIKSRVFSTTFVFFFPNANFKQ